MPSFARAAWRSTSTQAGELDRVRSRESTSSRMRKRCGEVHDRAEGPGSRPAKGPAAIKATAAAIAKIRRTRSEESIVGDSALLLPTLSAQPRRRRLRPRLVERILEPCSHYRPHHDNHDGQKRGLQQRDSFHPSPPRTVRTPAQSHNMKPQVGTAANQNMNPSRFRKVLNIAKTKKGRVLITIKPSAPVSGAVIQETCHTKCARPINGITRSAIKYGQRMPRARITMNRVSLRMGDPYPGISGLRL